MDESFCDPPRSPRTRLQKFEEHERQDVNDGVASMTTSDVSGCDLPACFLSTSVWDLCDQTNDVVEDVQDWLMRPRIIASEANPT